MGQPKLINTDTTQKILNSFSRTPRRFLRKIHSECLAKHRYGSALKQIHEAAKHFKEVKTPGTQCLLTEGPATRSKRDRYKQVREGFRQCGVRVTVEGELGARTITLRGFVERNLDVRRRLTASRRQSEKYTISQVIEDLNEVGATIYVEGNRDHIWRELRERYGLNSYSSTAHENGIGWIITRIK